VTTATGEKIIWEDASIFLRTIDIMEGFHTHTAAVNQTNAAFLEFCNRKVLSILEKDIQFIEEKYSCTVLLEIYPYPIKPRKLPPAKEMKAKAKAYNALKAQK